MLESYFNQVAGLKDYNFIKKRLQHSCFPLNIAKFLWAAFFTEHRRLLLHFRHYSTRKYSQEKRKETQSSWGLQLKRIAIHEDHNIHMNSIFCVVVLAVENLKKPILLVTYRNQVFLYFHFELKNKRGKRREKIK